MKKHDSQNPKAFCPCCEQRNNAADRLIKIREIIDGVETRCMAVDGPVTCTREEITLKELRQIYKLTKD